MIWIVWVSIFGTIASFGIMGYLCYIEYDEVVLLLNILNKEFKTIKRRCTLGKDVGGCGGLRATVFKVYLKIKLSKLI